MFSRKVDAPPAFQIPVAAQDRPSWVRVGVIAAVGFAIGIAWPRLTGLKLGPNAPEPGSHASAAAKSADPATSAPSAALTAPPLPPPIASTATAATNGAPTITFGHGFVLSCKTKDGDTRKGSACGAVGGFEGLAQPRLKKLAQCPAAEGISGKLAVVLTIDFSASHIGVDTGKQTTIPSPDGLYTCMRAAFQGAPIGGLEHDHARYSILYTVTLAAPAGTAGSPSAAASAQAGDPKDTSAQVTWETALVRDAPRNGQIVARLPRGTKLHLGVAKDGWYPIKYGPDFATEGWVYRGAIGK